MQTNYSDRKLINGWLEIGVEGGRDYKRTWQNF